MAPSKSLPPRYEGPVVRDFLLTLEQAQQELGDIFLMPFGRHDLVMVCHPDLAYEVLVKQNRQFVKLGADGQTPGLQRILGKGLLTNHEFSSWFSRRQLMQPFFRRQQLERFSHSIVAAAERLLESWRQQQTNLNLSQALHQVTLELIFELVFSLSPQEARAYPIAIPLSLASAKNTLVRLAAEQLDKAVYALIEARRQANLQGRDYPDLLQMLLNAKDLNGQAMNKQELRDELLTIFAAGHETTANTLLWALLLLSERPKVMAKVKQELATQKQLNAESLKDLPYLQALVKETLRLYPTIPFAPRLSLSATELSGFALTKGSRVFCSIYSIHRHKDFWEDARVFRPERFLHTKPSAYLPFGLGERVCLGQHLASLEVQLILAVLLAEVSPKVKNSADALPKVAISLQPKKALFADIIFDKDPAN